MPGVPAEQYIYREAAYVPLVISTEFPRCVNPQGASCPLHVISLLWSTALACSIRNHDMSDQLLAEESLFAFSTSLPAPSRAASTW